MLCVYVSLLEMNRKDLKGSPPKSFRFIPSPAFTTDVYYSWTRKQVAFWFSNNWYICVFLYVFLVCVGHNFTNQLSRILLTSSRRLWSKLLPVQAKEIQTIFPLL